MIDFRKSMKQTFEYYEVDPSTWKDKRKLTTVTECAINYDAESDTILDATLEIDEDLGESYVRAYLVCQQGDERQRYPLGCFLTQYVGTSTEGTHESISNECVSPLTEAKEKLPALGFSVGADSDLLYESYTIMRESVRMPVVKPINLSTEALDEAFVAETSDTQLSFNADMIALDNYHFELDDMTRLLYAPDVDLAAMQVSYEYEDGELSILYPDWSKEKDLYQIPNVVEVVYSSGARTLTGRAVNDDANSATSTVARGREIPHRITDASFAGEPTQGMVDEYAAAKLKELSTLKVTYTYKHAWNNTRINDCVLIHGVRARVLTQSIECTEGCPVTETAESIIKYWM